MSTKICSVKWAIFQGPQEVQKSVTYVSMEDKDSISIMNKALEFQRAHIQYIERLFICCILAVVISMLH